MVLVLACAAALPQLLRGYFHYTALPSYASPYPLTLLISLYLCCLPTLAALLCLDRLLRNIKNEQVFIRLNVKLLRVISWCCFAVALILLIAAWNYIFLILLSVMFGLFGLILRVVKNVIEEAVNLKTENDYTI
jgi:hypothetical protein